jgi:hypothetical protein
MSKYRRWIGVVLVLVFAGGVSWWSGKKEANISTHVRQEVTRLIPLFHSDPTVISDIVLSPILEPTLANSLLAAHEQLGKHGETFSILVLDGDNKEYGDGSATHVVIFTANEKEIAGLRIICHSETDRLMVAGAWTQ